MVSFAMSVTLSIVLDYPFRTAFRRTTGGIHLRFSDDMTVLHTWKSKTGKGKALKGKMETFNNLQIPETLITSPFHYRVLVLDYALL